MQQIVKRLTIIKASIELEDTDLLNAQTSQLQSLIANVDSSQRQDLMQISDAIANLDYPTALASIQAFITKMTNVAVYEDPEIPALKMELAGLENQLNELQSTLNERVGELNEFNHLFNVRLGEHISEILRLQMMLRHKKASQQDTTPEQQQKKQQAYEEAKETYQEYQEEYQEELEKPEPKELSKEDKKKLKSAFRKASKLCHPDMVAEELKEQANELFQVLNDAYADNDLAKVEEILEKLETEGIFVTASERVDDKEKLRKHIATLRQSIATVQAEINKIENDETYQVIEALDGEYEEYLSEKSKQLTTKLDTLREELMDG